MANYTIEIRYQADQCTIPVKEDQNKQTRRKDMVRWSAEDSDVCIFFAQQDWPFNEDYPSGGQIEIEAGKNSGFYRVVGLWGVAPYTFECDKCSGVAAARFLLGPNASIIISG